MGGLSSGSKPAGFADLARPFRPARGRGPRPLPLTTVQTDAVKPPKPAAPAAAPAAQPAAGAPQPQSQPAPLDSTALGNIANNTFSTNNRINALTQNQADTRTNLASQLAQLAYQQPRAQLALEQGANRAGNLYSSVYGQNLGNLNYQYAGRQGGLQNQADERLSALASQIAALRQGVPLYDAEQAAASAGRESVNAARYGGSPASPPPAAAPAALSPLAKAVAKIPVKPTGNVGKGGNATRRGRPIFKVGA